jgi:hypothetical protein
MQVAVNGFGSIWTRRFGRHSDSVTRYSRDAAFYNTTGVLVNGKMRARSRVYGVTRFDGSSGFTPHNPAKILHRVFECSEPSIRNGGNHLLFRTLVDGGANPDFYLVVVRADMTGWMDRAGADWKSPECLVISFSESDLRQEALVLMRAFGWVCGGNGVFVLKPETRCPGAARLVPGSGA